VGVRQTGDDDEKQCLAAAAAAVNADVGN